MSTFAYRIGFGTFCCIVIGIGLRIYLREARAGKPMSSNEFGDAKKSLSASSVGLSISASMMSISWSCVYGVQLFYWYGLGAAWLLVIPWLMAMAGFYLLASRFRNLRAFSQPEMIGQRFGTRTRTRQLLAVPLAMVFLIWCGAEMYAAAIILAPLLGTTKYVMLTIIASVVATYSYFWRDKLGHEIDCIIELADRLMPVEIKSGKTVADDYFKEIKYWLELSGNKPEQAWVVYGGEERQKRTSGNVIGWKNIEKIVA